MTTPDPDAPAPSPAGDGDQERSTPWSSTPWGASPWSGPPAPSGYEAQLPGVPGSPSAGSTGTPGGAGAPPVSPYAAPATPYAPPATPYAPPPAPGTPQAAPGDVPPAPPGGGFPPAGPYGTPAPDAYPGSTSPTGSYPAGSYPAAPYPGSPYPAGPPGAPYPYGTGAYPAWAPPQPRETDGLAIASLILSCSSFVVGLTAPVGLGLGIAALRRIRRTGAQGRGLAIAGVVVGGVMTAGAVAMVAFFILFVATAGTWATTSGYSSSEGGSSTTVWETPSYVLRTDLVPGDCLRETPGAYDMADAVVVDCGQPHAAEVLSTLPMTELVPADLNVWDPAFTDLVDRCDADASALLGAATLEASGWTEVYYPHADEWADGGRTAFCLLGSISEVTGSAVAGSYTVGARATT